jgi:HEAT repeat protein
MNTKKLSLGIAIVLVGLVMARVGLPRLGLMGHAIGTASQDVPAAVGAPAADLKQMLESRLTGKLALTVIERDGEGYRVRAELQNAKFTQDPSPKEDILPVITKPFYFTILPNGGMQSFFFAKGTSLDARVLLKQVATSMQAVTSPAAGATWKTTEQDVSGQYEASYAADGNTLTRSKTKFVQTAGMGGLMPLPLGTNVAVQSKTDYEVAPSGWAKHVASNESFDVHIAQAQIVAVSRTMATLGETLARPDLVGAMPAAEVEPESVSNARTAVEARHAADVKQVGNQTFAMVLTALQDPDKKTHEDAQQTMVSLLRIQPEDLIKAQDAVLRGLKEPVATRRLMYCIGQADTAEAQATLVSILESNNVEMQLDAAVSLGLVETPTEASGKALLQAMRARDPRLAGAALLAIGNMVHRIDPAKTGVGLAGESSADRLVSVVVKELDETRDDHQQQLCLDSLGNAGHAQTFAAVQPYLTSKNESLRGAAIEALRFIKGDAADRAVIAALSDSDASVRRSAVRTIGTRPVEAVLPALASLMQAEKNSDIRLAVVHGLNLKRSETPAVDTLIASIASTPTEKAGALAKRILAN